MRFDELAKIYVENVIDENPVLFMKLATYGRADLEDELSTLLEKSYKIDMRQYLRYYGMNSAGLELFDDVLEKLDAYNWCVTFKDFDCWQDMVVLFCYCTPVHVNDWTSRPIFWEIDADYKYIYESLASNGFFSRSQFSTDRLLAGIRRFVLDGMSVEYYSAIVRLCGSVPEDEFKCDQFLMMRIAENIPSKELAEIGANAINHNVRAMFAEWSPSLTHELELKLADDAMPNVRLSLAAANRELPDDVLAKLSSNISDINIAHHIARHAIDYKKRISDDAVAAIVDVVNSECRRRPRVHDREACKTAVSFSRSYKNDVEMRKRKYKSLRT
jgi:hypothetical protein